MTWDTVVACLKQHAARSVLLAAQVDPAHELAEFAELYLYPGPQSESLTAPPPAPSLLPHVTSVHSHKHLSPPPHKSQIRRAGRRCPPGDRMMMMRRGYTLREEGCVFQGYAGGDRAIVRIDGMCAPKVRARRRAQFPGCELSTPASAPPRRAAGMDRYCGYGQPRTSAGAGRHRHAPHTSQRNIPTPRPSTNQQPDARARALPST